MKLVPVLVAAILLVSNAAAPARAAQTTVPVEQRTYTWYGRLVSLDEAQQTATVAVRILPHIERYADRFKTGDRLVLVWDVVGKTEAVRVRALFEDEAGETGEHRGAVLPIGFVSANVPSQEITFTLRVPTAATGSLRMVMPGQWIKAITPMVQRTPDSTLTTLEVTEPPAE